MNASYSFGPPASSTRERKELLRINGPRLDVIIRNPGSELSSSEVSNSFVEREAILDTGASVVCISQEIADNLQLQQTDRRTLAGVGGSVEATVYAGILEVPQLDYSELIELYSVRKGTLTHSILLGRTFLSHFIVTYDGPEGMFHFSKPASTTFDVWDG